MSTENRRVARIYTMEAMQVLSGQKTGNIDQYRWTRHAMLNAEELTNTKMDHELQ